MSNEAAVDFNQRRYESSRDKFLRAYRIAQVPKLAVWAARANEKLGHWVAAYELYRQALSLQQNDLWKADVQQQAQKDAVDELSKLQPRIPKLTINVEGANVNEVSVKLDDKQIAGDLLGVERLADTGQRQIVAQRGAEVISETVSLAEGEKKQVILKFRSTQTLTATTPGAAAGAAPAFSPNPATAQPSGLVPSKTISETNSASPTAPPAADQNSPRPRTERTWGWAGIGAGAAGLTLGAAAGLFVAVKHGDLSPQCSNDNCKGQRTSEVNTYNRARARRTRHEPRIYALAVATATASGFLATPALSR